jgi:hypothetical protein
VSEYIANLNAVPSAQDLQSSNADNFNLDEDLAMFTNTQFFDFDLGQDADLQPSNYGVDGREAPSLPPEGVDLKQLEFSIQGKPRLILLFVTVILHRRRLCCSTVDKVVSRSASSYYMAIYVSVSVRRPRCSDDMRWLPIKSCQSTGAIKIKHYTCGLGTARIASCKRLVVIRLIIWPLLSSAHGAIVDDQVPNIAPCHVVLPRQRRGEERRNWGTNTLEPAFTPTTTTTSVFTRYTHTHTHTHTRAPFFPVVIRRPVLSLSLRPFLHTQVE